MTAIAAGSIEADTGFAPDDETERRLRAARVGHRRPRRPAGAGGRPRHRHRRYVADRDRARRRGRAGEPAGLPVPDDARRWHLRCAPPCTVAISDIDPDDEPDPARGPAHADPAVARHLERGAGGPGRRRVDLERRGRRYDDAGRPRARGRRPGGRRRRHPVRGGGDPARPRRRGRRHAAAPARGRAAADQPAGGLPPALRPAVRRRRGPARGAVGTAAGLRAGAGRRPGGCCGRQPRVSAGRGARHPRAPVGPGRSGRRGLRADGAAPRRLRARRRPDRRPASAGQPRPRGRDGPPAGAGAGPAGSAGDRTRDRTCLARRVRPGPPVARVGARDVAVAAAPRRDRVDRPTGRVRQGARVGRRAPAGRPGRTDGRRHPRLLGRDHPGPRDPGHRCVLVPYAGRAGPAGDPARRTDQGRRGDRQRDRA